MIDHVLHRFRLASRELFNHYFHQSNPIGNRQSLGIYAPVEAKLFQAMCEMAGYDDMLAYGLKQPAIAVRLNYHQEAQIQICQDPDTQHWQDWVIERHENVIFSFIRFTDLHDSYEWDYHHVMVQIEHWPNHPDLIGYFALIRHEHAVYYREAPMAFDFTAMMLPPLDLEDPLTPDDSPLDHHSAQDDSPQV